MKVLRIVLIIAIIFTLGFIYTQSFLSREASAEQSDSMAGIIEEIIPPDTPAGEFIITNIRKIAHFTEFFVLGAEISLYMILFIRRTSYRVACMFSGLLLAFFDETIQIFSKRGPSISDVWIDYFGFMSAAVICCTGAWLIIKIRKQLFTNNEEKKEYGENN